ncbi:hypothetical protein CF8_0059 [Aeromonas phage CF8]|nr:hypothetical protein CF8_0059 [Aeromonas phage CF8]
MAGIVGTMDTLGWVKEPTVKIDRLIAYWFANRKDQSIIFRNIQSFQYVVGKHQDDKQIDGFLEDVQNNLRSFLLECFDAADVTAAAPGWEPNLKMFTLAISGQVQQDGNKYDIAHAVQLNGKTFEKIAEGRRHVR